MAAAARCWSWERVVTPLLAASVAALFPVVAFFGAMLDVDDDDDDEPRDHKARAPPTWRARCRALKPRTPGERTPPGLYEVGRWEIYCEELVIERV